MRVSADSHHLWSAAIFRLQKTSWHGNIRLFESNWHCLSLTSYKEVGKIWHQRQDSQLDYQFLHHHEQRVIIEEVASHPVTVLSGVPQGTVLGPMPLLCFTNDPPATVSLQTHLFANNCLMYKPISSIEDQQALQQDFQNFTDWAVKWGLRFNVQKCYSLHVAHAKIPMVIY